MTTEQDLKEVVRRLTRSEAEVVKEVLLEVVRDFITKHPVSDAELFKELVEARAKTLTEHGWTDEEYLKAFPPMTVPEIAQTIRCGVVNVGKAP